jgi:hypothetical protein
MTDSFDLLYTASTVVCFVVAFVGIYIVSGKITEPARKIILLFGVMDVFLGFLLLHNYIIAGVGTGLVVGSILGSRRL